MPNSNCKIDFLTQYFLPYFKYKYLKLYVAGLTSFYYVKGKDKAKTTNKRIILFLTEPTKETQH